MLLSRKSGAKVLSFEELCDHHRLFNLRAYVFLTFSMVFSDDSKEHKRLISFVHECVSLPHRTIMHFTRQHDFFLSFVEICGCS